MHPTSVEWMHEDFAPAGCNQKQAAEVSRSGDAAFRHRVIES